MSSFINLQQVFNSLKINVALTLHFICNFCCLVYVVVFQHCDYISESQVFFQTCRTSYCVYQ